MEHGTAAAGTKDPEVSGTLREGTGQAHCENNEGEKKSFHRLQPENEGLALPILARSSRRQSIGSLMTATDPRRTGLVRT